MFIHCGKFIFKLHKHTLQQYNNPIYEDGYVDQDECRFADFENDQFDVVMGICRNNQHDKLNSINQSLKQVITNYKNKITELNRLYRSNLWDKYKKLSNEYEYIFNMSNNSHNVSAYTPISRSFFKMWEMLHDLSSNLGIDRESPLRCMFLAEGPGGFVEAIGNRRLSRIHTDTYFGVTLKSDKKCVPVWKVGNTIPLVQLYGKDGTGNISSTENIDDIVATVGAHSIDFVTADGGFDFSSNFNHQEQMSLSLLLAEILAALMLQREGGSFIIKFFDCFNLDTIMLINVLALSYDNIHVMKPLTSRPANSERYFICTGYKGECVYHLIPFLRDCLQKRYVQVVGKSHYRYPVQASDTFTLDEISSMSFVPGLTSWIMYVNMYFTLRQAIYIRKTLEMSVLFSSNMCVMNKDILMEKIKNFHSDIAHRWCMKYYISSTKRQTNENHTSLSMPYVRII